MRYESLVSNTGDASVAAAPLRLTVDGDVVDTVSLSLGSARSPHSRDPRPEVQQARARGGRPREGDRGDLRGRQRARADLRQLRPVAERTVEALGRAADTMSAVSAPTSTNGAAPERDREATKDAPIGGQAVLEGVMMRGISTWAVAVRKPSAEQLAEGGPDSKEGAKGEIEVISEPLVSWTKRHRAPEGPGRARRGRARRVAQDRLPRARHLRERADAARRRGQAAGHRRRRLGGHDRVRAAVRGRPLLPAARRPDQHLLGLDPERLRLRGDREARPDLDLPGLPRADLAHAGPPARVRVPRRRAQDDLVLRGRRAAHAGERTALLALPPALRHELPAAGDDRGDRGLRAARQARLARGSSSRAWSASRSWPDSRSS